MMNDSPSGLRRHHATLPCHTNSPATQPPGPRLVEAVFFDLGGVLYDDTIWQRWLLQLLARMGLRMHYTTFFRTWNSLYQDDVAWGEIDHWQTLRTFLMSVGLSRGQVDEVVAAGRPRFRDFAEHIRPYPYVRTAVTQLAACGVHLGIACSAPLSRDELAGTLSRLRLTEPFQTAFSARDLPRSAASEDRFRRLSADVGIPASRIAFVGRQTKALDAAAKIGLLTIGFNREREATTDVVLEQYNQLPALIQSASSSLLAAG